MKLLKVGLIAAGLCGALVLGGCAKKAPLPPVNGGQVSYHHYQGGKKGKL